MVAKFLAIFILITKLVNASIVQVNDYLYHGHRILDVTVDEEFLSKVNLVEHDPSTRWYNLTTNQYFNLNASIGAINDHEINESDKIGYIVALAYPSLPYICLEGLVRSSQLNGNTKSQLIEWSREMYTLGKLSNTVRDGLRDDDKLQEVMMPEVMEQSGVDTQNWKNLVCDAAHGVVITGFNGLYRFVTGKAYSFNRTEKSPRSKCKNVSENKYCISWSRQFNLKIGPFATAWDACQWKCSQLASGDNGKQGNCHANDLPGTNIGDICFRNKPKGCT